MGKGGEIIVALNACEREKAEAGCESDGRTEESVGGPAEMPGWWMGEKLLCSAEFGEEESKKESLQRLGL